jgi:hypothetical protein
VQQDGAAFDVAKKDIAKAAPLMGAFDQAGNVCDNKFGIVHSDHTEIWMQRGERVIRHLGSCIGSG